MKRMPDWWAYNNENDKFNHYKYIYPLAFVAAIKVLPYSSP